MPKNSILLALNDPSETISIASALKVGGFETSAVSNGIEAIEKALLEPPSLIILDMRLPGLDGERLFRIVRGNLSTSRIPFIMITEEVIEIKGFMSGLDLFITRPVDPEEVLLVASKSLLQKESPSLQEKVIHGDLMHMSLADIIQFLHMNKKEGVLRVTSGDLTGSLYIKGGEVHNAVLEGMEKEKALFRLLEWGAGSFEFTPSAVTSPRKIRPSTPGLVMEGVRQIDEYRKRRGELPGRKALLRLKNEAASPPKGLQPLVYEIMQNVRAHPSVEDLVDRCSYPDYEVYVMLSNMVSRGILEQSEAPVKEMEDLLGKDEGAILMERIKGRLSWGLQQEYAKIMLLSETGALVDPFIAGCASIPGFSRRHMAFSQASIGEEFGEVASLKVSGGVDFVLFSVPDVRNMGPLINAFSSNAAALILLYGGPDFREVLKAREEMSRKIRLPAVHVVAGEAAGRSPDEIRGEAGLRADEPVFAIRTGVGPVQREVFQSLLASIIKDAG